MGNLPAPRVNFTHAFLHTRCIFAVLILIKSAMGRGSRSYKAWIAIFVCICHICDPLEEGVNSPPAHLGGNDYHPLSGGRRRRLPFRTINHRGRNDVNWIFLPVRNSQRTAITRFRSIQESDRYSIIRPPINSGLITADSLKIDLPPSTAFEYPAVPAILATRGEFYLLHLYGQCLLFDWIVMPNDTK